MTRIPRPIRGIIPPVLTPLLDRDTLDRTSLEKLLEHLIQGGSNALFILGSTGEAPSLSYQLRHQILNTACKTIAGRTPVLVGITDTSFTESVKFSEAAAKAGADAVVLAPPYYYGLSQNALEAYIERIAPQLSLPLYLYNMPGFTKINMEPSMVRNVSSISNIWGVKDSSGNIEYFRKLLAALADKPDFSVLSGSEELLAESVAMGGHGGVCGGANVNPRLYVDLYEAAVNEDSAKIAQLQETVMDFSNSVYKVGEKSSSYLRGLKCASSLMGFGTGFMAEPYLSMESEERTQIRQALVRMRMILQ